MRFEGVKLISPSKGDVVVRPFGVFSFHEIHIVEKALVS